MKCSACGRRLISSKSQESGYGPVCYKRLFGTQSRQRVKSNMTISSTQSVDYNIPGQISIDEYLQSLR